MHITKEQLDYYMLDKMSQTEQMAFFKHISECEFCAEKFADAMQEKELVFTPPDLKDNILEQTVYKKNTISVKLPQEIVMARVRNKQKELWLYTAKVAFAVCVSITIIMMPTDILPNNSSNSYTKTGFPLTKEITGEEVSSSLKILDLFRNTSVKISDNVSKALNLDKR